MRAPGRRSSRGFVGVVAAELYFPEATSLKEKRMYLRSIRSHLTRSCGATFAEVGGQDLWQRALVVFAIAASEVGALEQALDAAENYLASREWELVKFAREVLEVDA